jgi:hypothetical protein
MSAEGGTWWVGGTCRLATVHLRDKPGDLPPGIDLEPILPRAKGLASVHLSCHPEAGQPSTCRCPFGQVPRMQS